MKMNIKQLVRAALLSGAMAVAISACEVTDIQPTNGISETVVFNDAASIEAAMIGMYNAAQSGTYAGNAVRGYPFGGASTQQGDLRGEDMYNHQLFYEITYTNAQTPSTANNVWMWNTLYRLINRANIMIEGLEAVKGKGVLTEAMADHYLGEALAMRAMAHHELALFFSRPYSDNPQQNMGVPYRSVAINDISRLEAATLVGRGTVAETYTKVLADLDRAETLMSDVPKSTRFTKGAAIALKSRVKLHMKDWAGVVAEHAKLVALGKYGLETAPETAFRNVNSKEMLLAMDNSANSNGGANGALASMYGNPDLKGRGLVKISPVIWKASFWLPDDLRRTRLASKSTSGSFSGFYSAKYTKYETREDPTPLIRFAEVVLNAAEAQARLDKAPEALALLNSVRNRSLANPVAQAYTIADFAAANSLLQAILNERRVEFLAEGLRWDDIHRLSGEGKMPGIPAKAASRSIDKMTFYEAANPTANHSLEYADYRFVWPLPIDEILNNATLKNQQNPNYN